MLGLYYLYLISIFLSPNFYYFFTGYRNRFVGLDDFLLVFIVIFNFIIIILNLSSEEFHTPKKVKLIFFLLIFFTLWGLIGILFTPVIDIQTFTFNAEFISNVIFFIESYYIFNLFLREDNLRILSTISRLIIFIFICTIVIVILELLFPNFTHNVLYAYRYNVGGKRFYKFRIRGPICAPNTFAIIINFFIAFFFSKLITEQDCSIKNKLFYCISILISLIILFLTGSRGGLLSFLTQFFVFLCFFYKKNKKIISPELITIFLSILIIILGCSLMFKNYTVKIYSDFAYCHSPYYLFFKSHFQHSEFLKFLPPDLIERFYFWYKAIFNYASFSLFKKFLGIGLNGSLLLIHKFLKLPISSCHNVYIQFLCSTGIVGFILFIIFIVTIFKTLDVQKETYIDYLIYLFFITLIIHSFVESILLWNFKATQIFFYFYSLFLAKSYSIFNNTKSKN